MFARTLWGKIPAICALLLLFISFSASVRAAEAAPSINIPAGIDISPQQLRQLMQNVPDTTPLPSFINRQPGSEVDTATDAGEFADDAEIETDVDTGKDIDITQPVTLSSIEQRYRQQYNSPLAGSLEQYGYDFFQTKTTFTSKLAIPHDNYIIGPGDKLRVRIWGNDKDTAYTRTVRRDGTIDAPQIGIVPVAGTSFGKIEALLRHEAEKYVQGINLSVSMIELRSVEIYVIGEVSSPGLHLVPPFSTVLGGLIAGGGVNKSGSLRTIRLIRDGALLQVIDLYSLFLQGSRAQDLPLKDGDVLFVPRLGATAAVAGAVGKPAIYELTTETTVADLLELAGNVLPQTSIQRFLLRRFVDNQEFIVKDIDQRAGKVNLDKIAILNGDLLELQYLGTVWPKVVRLDGNVWMADIFRFRPDLKLSDILIAPTLLKPDSITEFALLHRYDLQTTRYRIERFPLSKVFSGLYDAELRPYDRIEILSRREFQINEPVKLFGSVWRPGTYIFTPGLALGDLLGMAGGFRFEANTERIDLSRQEIRDNKVTTTTVILAADTNADFPLKPYDHIYVRQVKDAATFKTVSIDGEIKYAGTYRIQDGMRLSGLIERAGGFTDKTYFYGAYFTSAKAKIVQQKSIDKMIDALEIQTQRVLSAQVQTAVTGQDAALAAGQQQAFSRLIERLRAIRATGRMAITLGPLTSIKGTELDFKLHSGDSLYLPQRSNFVSVVGSVYNASSFLYRGDFSMKDYLARAGGPTKTADEDAIYVVKANGEVLSSSQSGLFGGFWNYHLMPGDTIVVPEDLERIPYLKLITNLTDIIFKIAVTAGVIFAI